MTDPAGSVAAARRRWAAAAADLAWVRARGSARAKALAAAGAAVDQILAGIVWPPLPPPPPAAKATPLPAGRRGLAVA